MQQAPRLTARGFVFEALGPQFKLARSLISNPHNLRAREFALRQYWGKP